MAYDINDHLDVRIKLTDLGCSYPTTGIALLPINFQVANSLDDLKYASETTTIRKLLIAEHIPLEDVLKGLVRPPYIKNKSYDWVAPTLLFSSAFYFQNPTLVNIALNVLSSYAFEFFRGVSGKKHALLNIFNNNEAEGTSRHISYDGPPEGLQHLPNIVREAIGEK